MPSGSNLLSTSVFIRLVNIGLRGSSLLAKFLLIFLLAYYLAPKEVAVYGLLVATISYSIYVIGFDFYVYTTRELLGSRSDEWLRLLRDQSVFTVIVYSIILPLLFFLFIADLLPWKVAPWFFVLLVFEHLAQELNRLLVAMSRQLYASIAHFLRSGVWVLVVAVVFWLYPKFRTLEVLLMAWAVGGALACSMGFMAIARLDRACLKNSIDWRWLAQGVKVALPLLFATLAIRALFTVDRYWLEAVGGEEALAAYVLFAGVANAVTSFLDAGVFVFLYPKIVRAFQIKDFKMFESGMKSLSRQTVFIAFIMCMAAAVLIHPVLMAIGEEVYFNHVEMLYILLFSIFLFAVSMIPHYGLYAMGKDKSIIKSNVFSFFVFLGLGLLFTGAFPILGIPFSLCGAFFAMLVLKAFFYYRLKRLMTVRFG